MLNEDEKLEVALDFLSALGLEPTEDNLEHLQTLTRCLVLYDERSESYGQVWKQYGARSNLVRLAGKADRLMQVWWHNPDGAEALHKDAADDAEDAINYAAFFLRNARAGNFDGQSPNRTLIPDCICSFETVHVDNRPILSMIKPRPNCPVHGVGEEGE